MSATPFTGIRVLEFSHTVMGPTAGLVFAELGAEVIKVEPAPEGDHTRGLGGFGATACGRAQCPGAGRSRLHHR
jgi:crotonobetainyl-CoA:carnitine CoA-transferase CaiB-like acyl-CoA transferase